MPVTPALDGSVTCSVAAGQGPRHPRVDGAEAQVALAVGVGDVEQDGELGGRGAGGDVDALGLQAEAHARGAQVLPADPGTHGDARGPVPQHRRRPLVGDAHRRHRPAGGGERGPGHLQGGGGHQRRRRTRRSPGWAWSAAPGGGGRGTPTRRPRRWRPGPRWCRRRRPGGSRVGRRRVGSAGGVGGGAGLVVREASRAPKMPVEQAMKAWKTRLKGSGPLLPAMARAPTTITTSTRNEVSEARAPWTRGASRRWRPAYQPAATWPPRSTK